MNDLSIHIFLRGRSWERAKERVCKKEWKSGRESETNRGELKPNAFKNTSAVKEFDMLKLQYINKCETKINQHKFLWDGISFEHATSVREKTIVDMHVEVVKRHLSMSMLFYFYFYFHPAGFFYIHAKLSPKIVKSTNQQTYIYLWDANC